MNISQEDILNWGTCAPNILRSLTVLCEDGWTVEDVKGWLFLIPPRMGNINGVANYPVALFNTGETVKYVLDLRVKETVKKDRLLMENLESAMDSITKSLGLIRVDPFQLP